MSNTITIKDPNGNIVCSVENMDPIKSEEGFINKLTGYVPFTVANRSWSSPESFLNVPAVKKGLDKFIADVTKSGKFKVATMKDVETGKKAFMSTTRGHNEVIEKYGVVFVIAIPTYINLNEAGMSMSSKSHCDIRVKFVNTKNGKIVEKHFANCFLR